MYKLLETINSPADLRKLPRGQLKALAEELRAYLLDTVSKTGGHLSSTWVRWSSPWRCITSFIRPKTGWCGM